MKMIKKFNVILISLLAVLFLCISGYAEDSKSSIAVLNSDSSAKEYSNQNVGSYSDLFNDVINTLKATDINFEIIKEKELANTSCLQKYKIIIVPLGLSLSENILDNLKDYTRSGGKIIVSDPGTKYTETSETLAKIVGASVNSSTALENETNVNWLLGKTKPEENTMPPGTKVSIINPFGPTEVMARWASYGYENAPAVTKSNYGSYIGWTWGTDGNISLNSFIIKNIINSHVPGLTNLETVTITSGKYDEYLKEINQLQSSADGAVSTVIQADLSVPLTKIQEHMYLTEVHKALFESHYNDRLYAKAQQEFNKAKISIIDAYARAIPSRLVEGRALWLDRGTIVSAKKPADMKKLFAKIAQSGINVVYFEAINAGFPLYPSQYIEQSPLTKGYDPLATAIKEAHDHDIELHAWTWVFAVGNTRHNALIGQPKDYPGPVISNNFYDGALLGMNGNLLPHNQPEYWLDPANPEVKNFMYKVLEEIVRKYNVDGVQLDYIRYPFQSNSNLMGYDFMGRELFESETGRSLDSPNAETLDIWTQWKTKQVSDFVCEISRRLRVLKPNIQISAAVYAMNKGKRLTSVQQDWETWIENGWVDTLSPMSYATNPEKLTELAGYVNETCKNKALVYPGLAIRQLDTSGFLEQLDTVRSLGMVGSTLFAMAHLSEDKLDILETGPYRNKSLVVPNRDPLKASSLLLEDFLVRVHRFINNGKIFSFSKNEDQKVKTSSQELYALIQKASIRPTPSNIDLAYNKSVELSRLVKDWLSFENNLRPGRVRLLTDYLNQITSILAYAKHKQLTKVQISQKNSGQTTSW